MVLIYKVKSAGQTQKAFDLLLQRLCFEPASHVMAQFTKP